MVDHINPNPYQDELNTGHEVFGQWPVESLFQCLFLVFFVFFLKKVNDMNECTWCVRVSIYAFTHILDLPTLMHHAG